MSEQNQTQSNDSSQRLPEHPTSETPPPQSHAPAPLENSSSEPVSSPNTVGSPYKPKRQDTNAPPELTEEEESRLRAKDSPNETSAVAHFFASVKKNSLQKVRAPVSCALEVLLPVVFLFALVGISLASTNKDYPEAHLLEVNATSNSTPIIDTADLFRRHLCIPPANYTVEKAALFRNCTTAELADLSDFSCIEAGTYPTKIEVPFGFCAPDNNWFRLLDGWVPRDKPRLVPSFDELVIIRWIAHARLPDTLRQSYQSLWAGYSNGMNVYWAPNTPRTVALINYFNTTSRLYRYVHGGLFATAGAMDNALKNNDLAGTILASVDVSVMTQDDFLVVIRQNRSGIPWTNRIRSNFFQKGTGRYRSRQYISAGFITIEQEILDFYHAQVLAQTPPPRPSFTPMPYVAYTDNTFLQVSGILAPLVIVLSFLFGVSQLTKRIVEEKEARLREAMMIMGLGTGSFYTSWLVTYGVLYLATALLMAIVSKFLLLPQSDFFLAFLLFYLFSLTTICLAGIFSALMSKSRVAGIVAPILFFLMSIPSFALPQETPAGIQFIIGFFLSPTSFGIGTKLLFEKEQNTGATWGSFASDKDLPNMATVFFLLIWNFVSYTLIMLYMDAVTPSEWGTRRHPLFCCVEPYRYFKRKREREEIEKNGEGAIPDGRDKAGQYEEVDHTGSEPTVRLRGLRKEFTLDNGENFVAVNDLTYDLYEGEITMLLGHNGAGKTTAINCMTGMLEPTSGDCTIYGKSVIDDLKACRQEIGLCPQHNILWDELTCREHMEFYGRLKGLSGEELTLASEALLKAVDLGDKIDELSPSLSGGQKRKLSVAIAFVGGSRVVFLDEPTAGMDPAARRHTWDLIRRMSKGRTIIITTHFMDEADLLGNQVAIMSKGSLKCSGSPLFLKSRLGVGYNLNIAIQPQADSNGLQQIVKSHVSSAVVINASGGELAFQLPMDAVPNFPPLLRQLEDEGKERGIRGYGMSVTTLEEIFIKIGKDEELGEEVALDGAPQGVNATAEATAVPIHPLTDPTANNNEEDHTPPHSAAYQEPSRDDEEGGNPEDPMWHDDETGDPNASALSQFVPLILKRFHIQRRDIRTIMLQIIVPIICLLFAMLMSLIKFPSQPLIHLSSPTWDGTDSAIGGCPAGYENYATSQTHLKVVHPSGMAQNLSDYLLATHGNHELERLFATQCTDPTTTPYANIPMIFNNESFRHSLPTGINDYHAMAARYSMNSTTLAVTTANWPLELSELEEQQVESISILIVGIFILIPFTLVPSTFVSFVVKERENKAKSLQITSGMNFVMYWAANYVFDFLAFVITILLAIIVFLIFDREEYVGSFRLFGATFVLFMFYGIASVANSYAVSFVFDSHGTAQNIVMLANFICGFLLVLLAYFLSVIESTEDVGKALKFVFRIVPAYCLGDGIIQIASIPAIESFLQVEVDPFDMDVTGWNILYCAISMPIYLLITIGIDSPLRARLAGEVTKDGGDAEDLGEEDEDVIAERERVLANEKKRQDGYYDNNGDEEPEDVVVVQNLRKVYPGFRKPKVAVRNLTFGVHRREVFGFLGTNGAGKTTSISILCGEFPPTRGTATIDGFDVVKESAKARTLIGYCPQFDALHDLLTPEEHLYLYSGMRGLPISQRPAVVNRLMEICDLVDHKDKVASALSGGNKRKLSVAISLIGGPRVVFLDEPSAGMDPMARRVMFNVIQRVAKQSAVVLTTHHLEEVEVLADRVAIMDKGAMKCFGPLQALKSKFGTGFEMSVRVKTEKHTPALEAYVKDKCGELAEVQESRGGKVTFKLPKETKLSEVFAILEAGKEELSITDYGITQTSLESVFLQIAEEDEEDEEQQEAK